MPIVGTEPSISFFIGFRNENGYYSVDLSDVHFECMAILLHIQLSIYYAKYSV